ncbi:unnamed protein product [Fraxinus pennsylvanica]|uniref:Uncharacterized protein n=1 Tax=Fraxinus pennsylvanica TaxID=56036 RepID=A0AAD2DU29_9LAMI|nr:unnamed protein product [Fraxinus pennsylvanica]
MSCPHLCGIAAFLKSAHLNWFAAAIKSVMMITSHIVNLNNAPIEDERFLPANNFAIGSGHVNPSKAYDPGLTYDNELGDYVPSLRALVKSAHSNWFPTAMTTSHIANLNNAPIEDERFLPANNFAVGSGHVNLPRLMILG